MSKFVAVTIGDIKGIGIKILLETWKKNKIKNFILFTDIEILKKNIEKKYINKINIIDLEKLNYNYKNKNLNIYNFKSKSLEDNTYKSLKFAYKFCKNEICIGIITLPLRKDLIKKKIDKNFVGHTEFFQKIDKKKYSNMILMHNKLIVSPLTTHIEIKKIFNKISNKNYLFNQIISLNHCLKSDFNFKNPKLIVSGLNPHAEENGEIGEEEIKIIKPLISKLKYNGVDIVGPYSADSILINKNLKKYNCFIFMYHDQALIPFKLISKFSGVNYTGNLSIIRTSPDHGTAYNLINSKNISYSSFINCFKLVKKIYKNRTING